MIARHPDRAMNLLSRRSLLAIAAVVDVAMHARPVPAAAKSLAARHNLPPRHLETLLQTLVRSGILKGVRGPRGGYELARERRRISAGEIVRAAMAEATPDEAQPDSALVDVVIGPMVQAAGKAYLALLDDVSVDDLCRQAEEKQVFGARGPVEDFTI